MVPITARARALAFLTALLGLASLIAQAMVSHGLTGTLGATVWVMAGYFTVLTNLIVTLTFAAVTLRSRAFSAGWHGGLTLWIATVGVVYHLVLARLWAPEGLAWWADQGLHSAVPVLAVLWWLGFAPKTGLTRQDAAKWLGWPALYLTYALLRGAFTGRYPYPFVDVAALGYGGVVMNAAGLTLAFLIGGLFLVVLARRLNR